MNSANTISNRNNEKRIHEYKKLRIDIVKDINRFIKKHDMEDIKNQQKLQKRMESFHRSIVKENNNNKIFKVKFKPNFQYIFHFLLIIPFFLIFQIFFLIKSCTFLITNFNFGIWQSFFAGFTITVFISFMYLCYFSWRKTETIQFRLLVFINFVPLIILSLIIMINRPDENIKTDYIRSSYKKLHPILKMGVGISVLVDRNLVITDIQRTADFYSETDIPMEFGSLHFVQEDGYVHAIDIRTIYRSNLRNFFLKWYYKVLGFNVLRHNGTEDHLHICI